MQILTFYLTPTSTFVSPSPQNNLLPCANGSPASCYTMTILPSEKVCQKLLTTLRCRKSPPKPTAIDLMFAPVIRYLAR
jgi:hypothetical protein